MRRILRKTTKTQTVGTSCPDKQRQGATTGKLIYIIYKKKYISNEENRLGFAERCAVTMV